MNRRLPSWLEDAVFYEIYPQSFKDSNNDGIGDIPGMTSKLAYIRSLGCNAIWLNPLFVWRRGEILLALNPSGQARVLPREVRGEILCVIGTQECREGEIVLGPQSFAAVRECL